MVTPSADTLFLTSGVGVSDSHGMDIIFTQHARARMADPHRGVVTEEEVRSVAVHAAFRLIPPLEQMHDQDSQTTPQFSPVAFSQVLDFLCQIQRIEFPRAQRAS